MPARGCCKASSDKKIQHINHTIIYKKNPPEVNITLLPKDFFYDSIFKNNIFYDSIFSNDRIIKHDCNLLASRQIKIAYAFGCISLERTP